jgi:hypothetical protein
VMCCTCWVPANYAESHAGLACSKPDTATGSYQSWPRVFAGFVATACVGGTIVPGVRGLHAESPVLLFCPPVSAL